MSILHLQHQRSDGERDVFHLKNVRRYHLGRGSVCEMRILDMKMSRQHCAFEEDHGSWYCYDLGSTNGVLVNGERVQKRQLLQGGEQIHAGSTNLNVLAISEHLDLAPEELMLLGETLPEVQDVQPEAAPQLEQEPMPEGEDPFAVENDNPWDGQPQDAIAEQENAPTVALQRVRESPQVSAEAGPDVLELANNPLPRAPLPTPVHQPQSLPSAASADALDREKPLDRSPTPARVRPLRTPLPEPLGSQEHDEGAALEQKSSAPARAAIPEPPSQPAAPPPKAAAPPPQPAAPAPKAAAPPPPPAAPAPKAAAPPPPPAAPAPSPRQSTTARTASEGVIVNLLGQRIGPIPRDQARELKKQQIMGTLTEADLAQYPKA